MAPSVIVASSVGEVRVRIRALWALLRLSDCFDAAPPRPIERALASPAPPWPLVDRVPGVQLPQHWPQKLLLFPRLVSSLTLRYLC